MKICEIWQHCRAYIKILPSAALIYLHTSMTNTNNLQVTTHTTVCTHGRNLVGDTGDVSPPHFFRRGGIICHVPHCFLFRFCIWWGFKNKSVVCHVLCDELFMLDGRPHTAMLMLKQKFGVVSLILLAYKFLASIK